MHRLLATVLVVAAITVTACSAKVPATEALVSATDVSALATTTDGSLLYADRVRGDIWRVDTAKRSQPELVTHVDTAGDDAFGLLGLAVDTQNRVFASWTDPAGAMIVGQIAPGPARIVWRGPVVDRAGPGGRMALAPTGRLLVVAGARLMTLDPDRGTDQRANDISKGLNEPFTVEYDQGGNLWAGNRDSASGEIVLARVGADGPVGSATRIDGERLLGLSRYAQQELVGCIQETGELQRFLINDRLMASTGRVLGEGCTGDVVEVADQRVAYVAGGEIRVTAR